MFRQGLSRLDPSHLGPYIEGSDRAGCDLVRPPDEARKSQEFGRDSRTYSLECAAVLIRDPSLPAVGWPSAAGSGRKSTVGRAPDDPPDRSGKMAQPMHVFPPPNPDAPALVPGSVVRDSFRSQ